MTMNGMSEGMGWAVGALGVLLLVVLLLLAAALVKYLLRH